MRLVRHWLIKFAPFRTSWTEIVRAGTFTLRSVRSPEACKHLEAMRVGDRVLFYHSQEGRAVMGEMEVTRSAYADPTSVGSEWLTCDFVPVQTFTKPIPLTALKADTRLINLPLVRQPRLAVMPIPQEAYAIIVTQGAK